MDSNKAREQNLPDAAERRSELVSDFPQAVKSKMGEVFFWPGW